jgi:hypothetical protein
LKEAGLDIAAGKSGDLSLESTSKRLIWEGESLLFCKI